MFARTEINAFTGKSVNSSVTKTRQQEVILPYAEKYASAVLAITSDKD